MGKVGNSFKLEMSPMHPPIMNADKTGKKSPPVPKGNKYSC